MKNLNFIYLATLVLAMVFTGCSNDDEPNTPDGCANTSWGEQTKAEADAVSAAAITFSTEPSKATCESFKTAYIDYVDALEALVPCVQTQSRQAFDNALKDGRAELMGLDCNLDFQ